MLPRNRRAVAFTGALDLIVQLERLEGNRTKEFVLNPGYVLQSRGRYEPDH
jgi:hypothetical protein